MQTTKGSLVRFSQWTGFHLAFEDIKEEKMFGICFPYYNDLFDEKITIGHFYCSTLEKIKKYHEIWFLL